MEDTNNQSATITSQQNKSVQMPASGTSSTSNVPPSVSSNTNPDGKKQPKMIKRKTFIIWLVIAILLSLFIGSSVSNSNSTDTNQTEELKSQLSQAKKKNTNLQNQINKLEAENKKLRSDNEANEQKLKADADARRKADESAQKKVTQEKQAANTPASTQQKQQNQTAPAPAPTKQAPAPAPASSGTVHGGSFCSTPGATGTSSSGSTLTCKTAKDGRLRWRR